MHTLFLELSLGTQSLSELSGLYLCQPCPLAGPWTCALASSPALPLVACLATPNWTPWMGLGHHYHLAFSGMINGTFHHQFCSAHPVQVQQVRALPVQGSPC